MLSAGIGGPVAADDAFQWYLRAHAPGNGVGRDLRRAVLWLRAAAEAGQPNAMHTLAGLYASGEGVARSVPLAYVWLSLATRTYPAGDPKRETAAAQLGDVSALLSGQRKAQLDAEIRAWTPAPARIPE